MAEVEAPVPTEEEQIAWWRAEVLERVGYTGWMANVLAVKKDVDLHLAVELLAKGCPERTAARILL